MSDRGSPDNRYDRRPRDDDWERDASDTILIKSLPDSTTEDALFKWFEDRNINVRDVRLVARRTQSGIIRAEVGSFEYDSLGVRAVIWISRGRLNTGPLGEMKVAEGYYSGLVYSRKGNRNERDREREYRSQNSNTDWSCPNQRCGFMNFAKRIECFRCGEKRPRSSSSSRYSSSGSGGSRSSRESRREPVDDGSSQVGTNPCNTVVLRGLDAFTTEASILQALAAITSLEPVNCYVMRDFNTGASMGFGFMEFDSVLNSRKVKEHFTTNQAFEVDGKLVMVNYAKNTYSTIVASIQYQANEYHKPTEYELQALAAKSANQVTDPTANGYGGTNSTQQHDPNAAPDTTRYVWEPSSGYYYDPVTTLYYDANTQYYYNGNTQQFLYWDGESKTYKPAVQTCDDKATTEKDKEEKKKKAKDIAKEMEKWAKSQNKKSKNTATATAPQVISTADTQPQSQQASSDFSSTADTAYDLLVGGKRLPPSANHAMNNEAMLPPAAALPQAVSSRQDSSGLVASYGGDDSDEDDSTSEVNYIDRLKLTCNLCERRFNSAAILDKHIQMSDLHKQNLQKLQQSRGQLTTGYRDRAKERRMKEFNRP